MAQVLPVQLPDGQPYFSTTTLRPSHASQPSLFIPGSPSFSRPTYPSNASSLPSSTTSSPCNSQIDLTHPSSFASTPRSRSSPDGVPDAFDVDDADDDTLTLPRYASVGFFAGRPARTGRAGHEEPPPSPISTPSAILSSQNYDDQGDGDVDDDENELIDSRKSLPNNENEVDDNDTATNTPESHPVAEDDSSIKQQPSRHVDYLSHEWVEEDIWSSWRHIVSQRRIYGERSRLENASWRTWAKQKNQLRTVPPDSLNWLKDCDVTWLYGPLQTARSYSISEPVTEATSQLSKNNSFVNKKPILKKRSVSEVMLQRSISTSSLVKQAAAAVQAQQLRPNIRHPPGLGRAQSDFSQVSSCSMSTDTSRYSRASSLSTSGLHTPDQGEKRHIRFDDRVEQCIAVDVKEADEDEETWTRDDGYDSDSDGGVVMMKKSKKKRAAPRNNSRSSLAENKTIEKLEPTTLKYRTDSTDVPDLQSHSISTTSNFWNRKGNLSPSPSQETLRPSNPSKNFLLIEEEEEDEEDEEDEDEEDGMSWDPSSAYARPDASKNLAARDSYESAFLDQSGRGMRRTESGMLMPYDENEDVRNTGILGKVVDTVNTARDIAHVIWNVGWRT